MSCHTNTVESICSAEIYSKPKNNAEAQSNWNTIAGLKTLVCCLINTEIISNVIFKVFNVTTPTSVFNIGSTLPTDPNLFEVSWNGQEIYDISKPDVGQVRYAISGTNIVLTMPIGDVDDNCTLSVKVLEKKKMSDVLICPELTQTPSCNCLCGC